MISQLPDFDRLLLLLFAILLIKVSCGLYSPRLRRRWKNAKVKTGIRWLWLVIDPRMVKKYRT